MQLTDFEQRMLAGEQGRSLRKAMEILTALGTIYGAEQMIPVTSVQIAGVSYDNLGEAGLEFLSEMAEGGGKASVLSTLNPAGMDVENWEALGISSDFAENQRRVLEAFGRMNIITTCTCTPYLVGNTPLFGEHIAWSESSAVCYANSVLGARSNREGGPSALAAALTGRTPAYGLHLPEKRRPGVTVQVKAELSGSQMFGLLGIVLGNQLEKLENKPIPWIRGLRQPSLEELKSLCASAATYGGLAMFHIEGITPEAQLHHPPDEEITIYLPDLEHAAARLNEQSEVEVDFVSLGCPHLSLREIARIAELLQGRKVKKIFWITTARPIKQIADRMGYTRTIEEAGAVFAVDTCCVVAPIRKRFRRMATDSAKACYYAYSKNGFETALRSFDDVVKEALG